MKFLVTSLARLSASGTLWLLLGVGLLLLELATSSLLAIFFAAGACVVAVMLWTGLIQDGATAGLMFLISSGVTLLFVRPYLRSAARRAGKK